MNKLTKIFSACVTSSVLLSANIMADDIDIYKKINQDDSYNNILFMIDTSGSMRATVSGTSDTRLQAVQGSMYEILLGLSDDVNVGVGAYNGDGGSIVYPIDRLGDPVQNISISTIYDGVDDGLETDTFTVYNNSQSLGFGVGTSSDNSNNAVVATTVVSSLDNATQCLDESNLVTKPSELILGKNSSCSSGNGIGLRFDKLNIPKNANIKNAYIELTNKEHRIGVVVDSEISIENSTNPIDYDYQSSSFWADYSDLFRRKRDYTYWWYQRYNFDIPRSYDSNKISWNTTGGSIDSKNQSPDLKTIIQELVNDNSWDSGSSALNFNIRPTSGSTSDLLEFYSQSEGDSDKKPVLVVEFEDEDKNYGSVKNIVGLNFKSVKISSNSKINKAELQLTSDYDYYGTSLNTKTLKIKIVDPRDSGSIVSGDLLTNRRIISEKTINFTVNDWKNKDIKRFDISDIVEQAMASSDWCGGQDLTIILEDLGVGDNKLKSIKSFDNAIKSEVFTSLYIEQGDESPNSCMIREFKYPINDSLNDGTTSSVSSSYVTMGQKTSALRFEGVNLTASDDILEASISLYAKENGTIYSNVYIDASNNYNPENYDTSVSGNSISERNVYGSSTNVVYTATDGRTSVITGLEGIVRNTVANASWSRENALSFIFKNNGTTKNVDFRSYDYANSDQVPVLTVKIKSKNSFTKETVREKIISEIATMTPGGTTPTLGSTIESYKYFTGENVYSGTERSRTNNFISHRTSWIPNDDTYIKSPIGCGDLNPHDNNCLNQEIIGNPDYASPMTDSSCETNSMIMLTDGAPTSSPFYALTSSIIGETCTGNWDCIISLTRYMANSLDLMPSYSNEPHISTNVIGFAMSSETTMHRYAAAGNGAFYTVYNSLALVDTISNILTATMSSDTSLAMPGVSVDQSNRLQFKNDLYFSVFKPTEMKAWGGNLKKYKVKNIATADSDFKVFTIVDQNDYDSVDTTTGFFKEDSQSYWSSQADGGNSHLGGAAENLPLNRNMFTYLDSTPPDNTPLLGANYKLDLTNPLLLSNLFAPIDQLSDGYIEEVDNNGTYTGWFVEINEYTTFLEWVNGKDIKDFDEDGISNEARQSMSDPLHGKPIIVDYNEDDVTVFISTNDGTLHGFDADNGEELFSFVPKRLLPNLYNTYKNGVDEHQYGLDLTWVAYRHDDDKNGDIDDADDFVYLYGGMRRGGDSLYAIDVTNIKASNTRAQTYPTLKWEINSETSSEFENIGQTWSIPVMGRIKYNGVEKIVLVFGGGYDPINDTESVSLAEQKGNQIYVVDAETGDLIWWASNENTSANLKLPDMDYSFANKLSLVDMDNDGYLDYIYANDTAGQIFKIKIDVANAGASSFAKGKVFAKLGKTDDPTLKSDRKYFEKISLIPVIDSVGKSLYIISGTGYRANPLSLDNKDGVFVLRDTELDPNDFSTSSSPITIDDLLDVTDTQNKSQIMDSLKTKDGYMIWMNDGYDPGHEDFVGEKIIGNIIVANNKLVFTSYVPDNDNTSCEYIGIGNSRKYVVDVYTGAPDRLSANDVIDETLSTHQQRYITEPLPGFSAGAKILYTADGVIAITNTSIDSLDDVNGLGVFRDRWLRVDSDDGLVPTHIQWRRGL